MAEVDAMDGCIMLMMVAALAVLLYRLDAGAGPKVNDSRPHNWAIVPESGDVWTTYSPTQPKLPYSRNNPSYTISLDEVHTTNIGGDGCCAVIRWKYDTEKIKRHFTKAAERDGKIVFWGDTPPGIEESFRKLSYTFWKDSWDDKHHDHFYTEEQVWNLGKGNKPIEILSVDYHDLRSSSKGYAQPADQADV